MVLKEVYASIFVNFAFNSVLLSPLIILGINIFDRHDVLVNSIGAFPQEIEAYHKIQWFIGVGYSLLQTMTIVQLATYYLYNGKYHPFARIVMPDRKFKFYEAYELKSLPSTEVTDQVP